MKTNFLLLLLLGFSLFTSAQEPLWVRYPSISPDGKTVAFSHLGEIFIVSSAGGDARALTRHPGHDFKPVWSKDGKHLAFASDRYGNFDIFLIAADGSGLRRLTYNSSSELPNDFSTDGNWVYFTSSIQDYKENSQFPTGALPELYRVHTSTSELELVLTTPALQSRLMPDGTGALLYEDAKGYENNWRKHQVSNFAKDIWLFDPSAGKHTKLTRFEGDDRNPVPSADGKTVYYLSESQGSFNVHQMSIGTNPTSNPITRFSKHPVRFLSASNDNTLCYFYDGQLYVHQANASPKAIPIKIQADERHLPEKYVNVQGGATEFALSPNGKEIAFIFRGEVFVTATQGSTTRRITNTPEQERSISFSPDGRTLLYASEREGSWNIYTSSLSRKEDIYFHMASTFKEETIVNTPSEEFQPEFSPDGKEVAYLEERTGINIYNLATKKTRSILPEKRNYSYADGDQYFEWSPDSKWLLLNFVPDNHWIPEQGMVNVEGTPKVINLTESGYTDAGGRWVLDGKAMIWYSDRHGMKNHASWGSQMDIYIQFFRKNAWERFQLGKDEFALLKESEDKAKKEEKPEGDKKSSGKESKEKEVKPLEFELEGLEYRRMRLTQHSSNLGAAILSPDGEKLYYLARFEKGYDLWVLKTREKETKLLAKLGTGGGDMILDKEGKNLYVLSGGALQKIETESGKAEAISIKGEMLLNPTEERAYMFEHAWRQTKKKFYKTDMHGVDWDFYKNEYKKFLPSIDNSFDFAEMLSELLGELNASHTGSGYRSTAERNDVTAALGVFFDFEYKGKGVRISEVVAGSPMDNSLGKIKSGVILEKIDGSEISGMHSLFQELNRKTSVPTLFSFYNELSKERWEEVIKPISVSEQGELYYRRWIARNEALVRKLSGGKLGYVHVEGMSDEAFRDFYEKALGKHANTLGLVVDTRFNGGGWLHDDLATFLSGKRYVDLVPREQKIGFDPQRKWTKPSVVVVNEGNYSDAHFFPFVYRELGIGKLVGSPVPGTATAVWWETMIDPSLYFGIPQIGIVDLRNNYLENQELIPDEVVYNTPESVAVGKDLQLEKAVEVLLKELKP